MSVFAFRRTCLCQVPESSSSVPTRLRNCARVRVCICVFACECTCALARVRALARACPTVAFSSRSVPRSLTDLNTDEHGPLPVPVDLQESQLQRACSGDVTADSDSNPSFGPHIILGARKGGGVGEKEGGKIKSPFEYSRPRSDQPRAEAWGAKRPKALPVRGRFAECVDGGASPLRPSNRQGTGVVLPPAWTGVEAVCRPVPCLDGG